MEEAGMFAMAGAGGGPLYGVVHRRSRTPGLGIIKIVLRVGLTGGLACGKSFVGEALGQWGCHVLEVDRLGHEALLPGGEAYAAVAAEFGSSVIDADGHIDRRALAAEVFGKPDRLALLNGLVHPPVMRREEEWLARVRAEDPQGIAVVEAAILIETGSYRRFDRLIVVTCDVEQQVQRSIKRDGASREEAMARLGRQMPVAEKLKFADFVIDTSGTKEETVRQARAVYESLRRVDQQ
jgi:dephospho-CoA kinase